MISGLAERSRSVKWVWFKMTSIRPVSKVAAQHAQVAAGNTDQTDQSLGFEFADRVQGAAGFDDVGEFEPLRVMEIVDVEAIDAQAVSALGERFAYPVAVEDALAPRGVCLGGDEDPLPAGPRLTQHGTDPAFALAITIFVRGVDEGETAIEGVTDGRHRLSLVYVVPVRVRHTAERARSQADVRHRDTV